MASPVKEGSTDILLDSIADGIRYSSIGEISQEKVYLNDYQYLPCQACGKSPEPDFCFFHDEIYPIYDLLTDADIILFGSPVYFDTVSAQAKLFIDRCNCLRPVDFSEPNKPRFKRTIQKPKFGAMVLVGGEREKFECARKVIAGFFKWVEIENCGTIMYGSSSWEAGSVRNDDNKIKEAFTLGQQIGSRLLFSH